MAYHSVILSNVVFLNVHYMGWRSPDSKLSSRIPGAQNVSLCQTRRFRSCLGCGGWKAAARWDLCCSPQAGYQKMISWRPVTQPDLMEIHAQTSTHDMWFVTSNSLKNHQGCQETHFSDPRVLSWQVLAQLTRQLSHLARHARWQNATAAVQHAEHTTHFTDIKAETAKISALGKSGRQAWKVGKSVHGLLLAWQYLWYH